MAFVLENDVKTVLAASVAAGASSVDVNAATAPYNSPPDPAGNTARLTLRDSLTSPSKVEIIEYTSRTDNGDGTYTLGSVTKGVESTSDQSWSAGDHAYQAATAAVVQDVEVVDDSSPQLGGNLDGQSNQIQDAIYKGHREAILAQGDEGSGTLTIDFGYGVQTVNITAAVSSIATTNSSGTDNWSTVVRLTNGASYGWPSSPSGVYTPGGEALSNLVSSTSSTVEDEWIVQTPDGGTTVFIAKGPQQYQAAS